MLTDATRNRDFPSLADMTYLNTAAEGIPPIAVKDAVSRYMSDKRLGMDGRVAHHAALDAAKAALERAGVEGGQIGHVVFGHIINTEPANIGHAIDCKHERKQNYKLLNRTHRRIHLYASRKNH